MNTAAKIAETNAEEGNSLDPLMGTCISVVPIGMSSLQKAISTGKLVRYQRTKEAIQDGADFFEGGYYKDQPSSHHLARYEYPFTSRNVSDWTKRDDDEVIHQQRMQATQEAAAMFLRDNPEYKLVTEA